MQELEGLAIELVSVPVIKHELVKIGESVSLRLKELNIENLVATNETLGFMKNLRAELNKEFKTFEGQRKAVKTAATNPLKAFEDEYKVQITEKYKGAVDTLKTGIDTVETLIKKEKEENVVIYFAELCQSEEIDFIKFEQLELQINLTVTEKKLKEQCNSFIEKVQDDIILIKAQEFEAEMMVEYKCSLNASKAVTDVKTRKENERIERERLAVQEWNKRKAKLLSIGLVFDEMVKAYVFGELIFMESAAKVMAKSNFEKKVIEIEEGIKEEKRIAAKKQKEAEELAKPQEVKPETYANPIEKAAAEAQPVEEMIKKQVAEPLKAPVQKKEEPTYTAKFEVNATMPVLKALKAYIVENNIKFKTL